ncbi:endonuclease/exonuclease/phosphatase family protein [Streptomyces sp. ERV7]|uniref:endonuclease/exonuclease/phosphatase family protein n=1 Tax=Streptomyces sp. ERV7 TaxID=1322334 RepID=UPI0018FE6015|nr:endonuclease/exonuclease/phosphatase family protein [Streptomyces sp. ERV7]
MCARSALALVLMLIPLAVAPTSSAAAAPQTLTVLTYNIHHGAGADDALALERVARVLRDSGADVVGLQEVDRHYDTRSDFLDQAGWLGRRLGMHVVYGANLSLDPPRSGAPRRQYGTAILSRFPVSESRNTRLPRPRQGEQRGLLEADINVDGTAVRVLTTHLEHTSQSERLAQAEAINSVIEDSGRPTVLVGDLNATPGAREVGVLTRHLADVWRTAGEGSGYTFDARSPHKRIDYVLGSSGIAARQAEVIDSDASDHLPVSAEVTLP